jgi:dTDP-4-dehydrorhamnose reductase
MRVLVLGASGMIGSTIIRVLSEKVDLDVFGTIRTSEVKHFFSENISNRLISSIDIINESELLKLFNNIKPDVVINCAGLTKHLPGANDPIISIPINALAPHRLTAYCEMIGARLIHISSDCVFSGNKGGYVESDITDATDLYGRTKAMGEVDCPHAITLRTSTIGHELQSAYGLLDWFLSQKDSCKGFTKAIFSGLPTVVFAQIIRDIVIPRPDMHGFYHVSGQSIAKYDLLRLIAKVYKKSIDIIADDTLVIDRSLNSQRFQLATGYVAPEWPELIKLMHAYK